VAALQCSPYHTTHAPCRVPRPVLYFFYPSYWRPSVISPVNALSHVLKEDAIGPGEVGVAVDEDVAAEEARMRALLHHRTGGCWGARCLSSIHVTHVRLDELVAFGRTVVTQPCVIGHLSCP
jgi:hypothetical protein